MYSRLSKDEITFIKASERRARERIWVLCGLAAAIVLLVGSIAVPKFYAEYIRRTALDCDLYAAEPDNNVHVPGVTFDRIIPEVAIPSCLKAVKADPGNPRIIHNLARSYDKAGKFREAASWYTQAVDLGWSASKNSLGVLYIYGRGVPLDFRRGVELVHAAAEQGNEDAVRNYTQTDLTTLFIDDVLLSNILSSALAKKDLLSWTNSARNGMLN